MASDQVTWPEDSKRTLREAMGDVWLDLSLLVEQHAALAAREVAERTTGLSVDLSALVAAVALLQCGVLALLASAGFALHAAGLAPWLAMLVVAIVAVAGGLGAALVGRARLVRRTTSRSETLLALAETSDWFAASLRGDRR